MNQQEGIVEDIHRIIIERYPMYQTNAGFEQWLERKADTDEARINKYLDLLDSYGYMNGDGTLANDYVNMPEPGQVVDDIRERISRLSSSALEALHRATIEGEHFCVETVAALSEIDPEQAGELVRDGENNGLVVRDGRESLYSGNCERYRFLPLQTREILYQQISDEERLRLHSMFVDFLSRHLEDVQDDGRREMLNQMISQHNKRVARPEPVSQKQP